MRWKIEVFHKILKSGCRTEDAKLRTADRLANLVALFCIVSWRVLWMTMMARTHRPSTSRRRKSLSSIISSATWKPRRRPGTLQLYITILARLGGYLARASDPPPSYTLIWRGCSDLLISNSAPKSQERKLMGNRKDHCTVTNRTASGSYFPPPMGMVGYSQGKRSTVILHRPTRQCFCPNQTCWLTRSCHQSLVPGSPPVRAQSAFFARTQSG